MKTVQKLTTLAFGLALSVSALGAAESARADNGLSSTGMNTVSSLQGNQQQAVVQLKTQALYRFQDRPWARMPLGVAITVRAPVGVTMADLHNQATDCSKQQNTPQCVSGANVSVNRNGGVYVIKVTSQDAATAREIQKRAQL